MAEKESAVETDLPKAAIKRLAKAKIDSLGEGNVQLHKDATLALAESAKVLIAFFTATANDICKEKKRQTISADDVLQALEEVDFTDLVAPLQVALDAYRQEAKAKSQKRAEATKKRKEREAEAAAAAAGAGGGAEGDAAAGQDQEKEEGGAGGSDSEGEGDEEADGEGEQHEEERAAGDKQQGDDDEGSEGDGEEDPMDE